MNNKRKIFSSINMKKYLLFIFLFALSIILMFNFKSKKNNLSNFLEDGKNKLVSYLKEMNPLYAKTNITNEDLFNFAFYKSLPLDKNSNKVLVIENEGNKEIIEIKTIPIKNTDNYNSYINYLDAKPTNKTKVDSILKSYKNKIYQNVFSSKNNAYAINPSIISIRENLLKDLLNISQKINPEKSVELFGKLNLNIAQIDIQKYSPNFLIITPDTVLETKINFDRKKLEKQIEKLNENIVYENDINKPIVKFRFNKESIGSESDRIEYKIDSNFFRITINNNEIEKSIINDSLSKALNQISEKIKQHSLKEKAVSKKLNDLHRLNIINPYEITKSALALVNGMNISKIVNDAIKKDSSLRESLKDSSKAKKIREEIKKANKTLKNLNLDTLEIK
ncbi:MAG: hypothetical protein HZA74_01995 [Ignavibacteriales bacterium]|nr:hypothetical protein [Ignavibacteriales bacterium]